MTILFILAALTGAFAFLFALWLLVWSFTMSFAASQMGPQFGEAGLPVLADDLWAESLNHSQRTR